MAQSSQLSGRRTSADEVFDYLYDQIVTLELKPGERISEAEIAAHFGLSRQPVRDAFSRLANLDLLLIRPQRATEVRRFSMRSIEKARFVRAAIDAEVLRHAATHCDETDASKLQAALDQQARAVDTGDFERFGKLDYEFHEIFCAIARADFAFEVILVEKAKVDRLCTLGIDNEQRMPALLADHQTIANAVIAHNADAAVAAGVEHLSRLNATIERITTTNADYFERDDVRRESARLIHH